MPHTETGHETFNGLTDRETQLAESLMEMLEEMDSENASFESETPSPEDLETGDKIFELKMQISQLQHNVDLLNRIQVKGEKIAQGELFQLLDSLDIDRSELGDELYANDPAQQRLVKNYFAPAIRNALAKERRALTNTLDELRRDPIELPILNPLENLPSQQDVEDRFGFMEAEGKHPQFDINTQKAMSLLKSEGWLDKHQNSLGTPPWYLNLARSSDLPLKYRFMKSSSKDNVLLFVDQHLYDSDQDIHDAMIGIPMEIAARVIPKDQIEQWIQ